MNSDILFSLPRRYGRRLPCLVESHSCPRRRVDKKKLIGPLGGTRSFFAEQLFPL